MTSDLPHPPRHPATAASQPLPAMRRSFAQCLASICLAQMLASCASGPYQTKLLVKGGDNLNPTFNAQPSKVNIRIVQVKARDSFESATEKELRANDLKSKPWVLGYQEAKIRVGREREIEIVIQPEVRFLGIVGLFNETVGKWRTVFDVDSIANNKLVINDYELSAQPRND